MVTASILALTAMLYGIYALTMNPYRGSMRGVKDGNLVWVKQPAYTENMDTVLTKEQAQEDMEFVIRHLRARHPAWMTDQDLAETVELAYQKAYKSLPETPTVLDLGQRISEILHHFYDGHTRLWRLPEHQLYLSDWSYLEKYGLPTAINGIDTETILEEAKKRMSYELDLYAENHFCKVIRMKDELELLGVDVSDGVDMTFETENGPETVHYSFVFGYLIKGASQSDGKWVSYTIDRERDVGVFTLKSCTPN